MPLRVEVLLRTGIMERIHELFEKYLANYNEWDELSRQLMEKMPKEQWEEKLRHSIRRKHELFEENNEITKNVRAIGYNTQSEEIANEMYEDIIELYYMDEHDHQVVLELARETIPYFEEHEDLDKLTMLYTVAQYEIATIFNLQFRGEKVEFFYNEKIRQLVKDFWNYSGEIPTRIVLSYYYYLVVAMDQGVTPIEDSFREFYKLRDVLDENRERMSEEVRERCDVYLGKITRGLFITITKIIQMNHKERELLYEYSKDYFSRYHLNRKSDYELGAMEYAGLLYIDFFENTITIEEYFDQFMDYFEYSYQRIDAESEFTAEHITEYINAIEILTIIAGYLTDEERIEMIVKSFMTFAEGRWIKGHIGFLYEINQMLCNVCVAFFKLKTESYNKEKSILQLVIQRNLDVYLHGLIVSEISEAIYNELMAKHPDYFDEIAVVPKNEIKQFLKYGSMFCDIGFTPVLGAPATYRRKLTPDEAEREKNHTQFGAEGFAQIPELSKYEDIIRGHHKYYDGTGGYPENYDNTQSPIRKIVDIISLAVAIDDATDMYSERKQEVYGFREYLSILEKEKNHQFSGTLIELILDSESLKNQLEKIVTSTRLDTMYEVYHNWEKIQLAEDEASILSEIIHAIQDFKENKDFDSFEPYFLKLKNLAKTAENIEIRGEALYYLCWVYDERDDLISAKAVDLELMQILEKMGNPILLARQNFLMGAVEIKDEAYETAVGRYLTAAAYAQNIQECSTEETLAYNNVATIYANLHHYERAIVYYDKALSRCEDRNSTGQLNILCGKGYCHLQLEQTEEVKKYCDLVINLKEEWRTEDLFAIYTYLANFEFALGNQEKLREYLNKIEKVYKETSNLMFYSSEIFIYLDLLEKMGECDILIERLEYYLSLCEKGKASYQTYSRLIQYRIRCASLMHDIEAFTHYGDVFQQSMEIERLDRAKRMEKMESEILGRAKHRAEREQMERDKEELERSVVRANNASEQKTAFLSSMSHEIRTPINAIIGLNEMILRESTQESILQYAQDVNHASKQLLGIINDVLDFSKIEAGKMEIVSQRYDLRSFLSDLKIMFEAKAKEKKLGFSIHCDKDIPFSLIGDELRNKQLALNILSNAFKYTKEGSVDFSLAFRKADEKSIWLRMEVRDTGIGMKPEEIDRLAIPFERLDLVENRGIEGTGLGMSIVTRLLKQMGSKLEVSSVYGQGSTFAFEIRQEVHSWNGIGDWESYKVQMGRSLKESLFHAPKAEILVVDDNVINIRVTKALLKRTGAKISEATSGFECLEMCEEQGFHIVLLDHMMPELDGVETLARLRKQEGPNKDTIVIALTANAISGADEYYKSKGFDDVLTKPISPVEMERKIMNFLPQYLLEEKN